MAENMQPTIDIEVIVKAIEQKFAVNVAKAGIAPTLSTQPVGERDFVPFVSDVDGITRMKNPGATTDPPGTLDEADDGGLFVLNHLQPGVLEWVMMDLGDVEAYTVSIVTSAGDWEVDSGTAQFVVLKPTAPIMPGESVKIVAADPGANKSWMRIYVRSDQARH
jgi:hypothetical protein